MAEPVKLFQYNTLGADFGWTYGGSMTIGELLKYGDLGLHTGFHHGELIVLMVRPIRLRDLQCPEAWSFVFDVTVPYVWVVVPYQAERYFPPTLENIDEELNSELTPCHMGKIGAPAPSRFTWRIFPTWQRNDSKIDFCREEVCWGGRESPRYHGQPKLGNYCWLLTPECHVSVQLAGHLHLFPARPAVLVVIAAWTCYHGRYCGARCCRSAGSTFQFKTVSSFFAKFNVDEVRSTWTSCGVICCDNCLLDKKRLDFYVPTLKDNRILNLVSLRSLWLLFLFFNIRQIDIFRNGLVYIFMLLIFLSSGDAQGFLLRRWQILACHRLACWVFWLIMSTWPDWESGLGEVGR